VADHIDRAVQIVGPAHVGLGTDFDGTDSLAVGLEDVTCLPMLTAMLLDRGHGDRALTAILGGNWLRLLDRPA